MSRPSKKAYVFFGAGVTLAPGAALFAFGSWLERSQETSLLNLHAYPLTTLWAGCGVFFGLPWCLMAAAWSWQNRGRQTLAIPVALVAAVILVSLATAFAIRS